MSFLMCCVLRCLIEQAHKRRDLARVEIVKIFSPIIKKRRDDSAKGLPAQDDYLQVLVDAKYRDGTSPTGN